MECEVRRVLRWVEELVVEGGVEGWGRRGRGRGGGRGRGRWGGGEEVMGEMCEGGGG